MARDDVLGQGHREVWVASAARTSSSASSAMPHYGGMSRLVVQVDVTAASGVTPSLTVTVEDSVDGLNFVPLQAFSPVTSTGRSVQRITTAFTDLLRVSWTITGGTPSFTFSVSAYSEP